MRVQGIEVFQANIPFRFDFRHAAAQRSVSESIFVKLTLENGVTGWGEGLPRPYVTGETVASSCAALRDHLIPLVLHRPIAKAQDAYDAACMIAGEILPGEAEGGLVFGAARCALETALLDAAGKHLNIPFHEWLGPLARQEVFATAVLPGISPGKLPWALALIRLWGFKAVKVKVGTPRDTEVLQTVRRWLGPGIALLVDANGAWQPEQAIENLLRWKAMNIASVEQPVAARDYAGMRRVREKTGLPVMADESLRTLQDAENLIGSGAADIFNIRLSKCGGAIASWKILKLARAAGIRCQLGCQVGESSVLAAAGRAFALAAPDLAFFEGGYGRILLKEDPAYKQVNFGWKGGLKTFAPVPGLGIEVIRNRLL